MATETCDGVDANCDGVTAWEYLTIDPDSTEIYLRFDLSSVPSGIQIVSVRLELRAFDGYAYGGDGNVYTTFVPDDLWDELAITWANKPGASPDKLGFWWLSYDEFVGNQVGANESPLLVPVVQEAVNQIEAPDQRPRSTPRAAGASSAASLSGSRGRSSRDRITAPSSLIEAIVSPSGVNATPSTAAP
jgi:hypothetical protein